MTDAWPFSFDAVLGLGSNMGDKAGNIRRALALLADDDGTEVATVSALYRTAPWGVIDQDWFVNACATVRTRLSSRDLLKRCLAIEAEMKRVRELRWGPRIIDIDILVFRDEVSPDPELTIPHPRITARSFILVPMAEIAPDVRIAGRRIADWRDAVDCSDVVPFQGH